MIISVIRLGVTRSAADGRSGYWLGILDDYQRWREMLQSGWQDSVGYSLMERFGRLTFPNGRTGAPVIDGDLVIVRGVTSYWGKQGPARDRFYAFNKSTGVPVWASTPGVAPKDSSFSTPVLANVDGRRVFYVGTGDGNVACVDVRTGQALWRFQFTRRCERQRGHS